MIRRPPRSTLLPDTTLFRSLRRTCPARDRGPHGADRRRRRLRFQGRPAPHRRRPRPRRGTPRCRDRDDRSRRDRFGLHRRVRRRDAEGRRRDPPFRGGRAPALVSSLFALVCHRLRRRGLVPRGRGGQVDVHHRPFFHGHDVTVAVPAESLHVVRARGLEFGRTEFDVPPSAGETRIVECDPPRPFDPTAEGWYGGDVHVHMNYSGDLVCAPSEAARMQLGEGLHLVNLVAANFSTSLVYDRDMLKQFAGADLPWSTDAVARVGVEYRNDLLGHVHALGPSGPPTRYYAGHEQSDHPEDWPPNKVACEELRVLGATVGYPHPAFTAFPADWSIARFFQTPRSVEARELVADAALGVVDSVDLISPFDDEGAVFLYHPLLSCGLRLAATAGTGAFLSFSHGPGA